MPYYAGMKRVVFLLSLLAFSGCNSGGIGMVGSPAWFMSTTPEQRAEYFTKTCQSYGFKPGTVEIAQCIQSETNTARGRSDARIAATTNCTSTAGYGGVVRTTCY